MLGVRVRTLEGLENDPQSDSVLWEPIGIIVELRNEIDRLRAALENYVCDINIFSVLKGREHVSSTPHSTSDIADTEKHTANVACAKPGNPCGCTDAASP